MVESSIIKFFNFTSLTMHRQFIGSVGTSADISADVSADVSADKVEKLIR